jgi:hypothetical protein
VDLRFSAWSGQTCVATGLLARAGPGGPRASRLGGGRSPRLAFGPQSRPGARGGGGDSLEALSRFALVPARSEQLCAFVDVSRPNRRWITPRHHTRHCARSPLLIRLGRSCELDREIAQRLLEALDRLRVGSRGQLDVAGPAHDDRVGSPPAQIGRAAAQRTLELGLVRHLTSAASLHSRSRELKIALATVRRPAGARPGCHRP